jgi:3-oxoadipate enol-lactonase
VLADTTACYGPKMTPMWDDRIRVAEAQGIEPLLDRTMEAWFTPAFRGRHPEVIDRVRAMLRPTDVRGYVGAIRAIGYVDLREAIRAIRCPTLILVGEQDHGTDLSMAKTMHERIAGSELSVLPNAAHCSCVEAAEAFTRAVLAFVQKVA